MANIDMPSGLRVIGDSAFENCSSLGLTGDLSIPGTVEELKDQAFYNTNVENIVLPNGITTFNSNILGACPRLRKVAIPANVTEITGDSWAGVTIYGDEGSYAQTFAAENGNSFEANPYPGFVYDAHTNSIVSYNGDADDLDIPSVFYWGSRPYTIEKDAFAGTSIQTVSVRQIHTIGSGAFKNCSFLTGISPPDSLDMVSEYLFDGCGNLGNVTIPDGATEIGNYSFHACTSVTQVTVPDSVTRIGRYAYGVQQLFGGAVCQACTHAAFGR